MTLSELLESRFRGDIRFRGAAYLQAERVSITRVTPDHVFGLVRDGVEYQTQLTRDDSSVTASCSCQTANGSATCKHVWATILAVDNGNYLPGGVKPGLIPPFVTETEPSFLKDNLWEEDDSFDEGSFPTGMERRSRPVVIPAPPAPLLRDWEIRLNDVKNSLVGEEAVSAAAAQDRQIFYEIDPVASDDAGQLVIQTSHRQRRSNGDWGKLKPLKVRPGKLDDIEDDEDRRILAYLNGGTPDRSQAAAGGETTFAAVSRYRIPHDLCELLLPAICATGRMRLVGDEERTADPILWDDGPPWELCLTVEQQEPTESWKLIGRLQRGTERLSIRTPSLIIPGGMLLWKRQLSRLQDFEAFAWVSLLRRTDDLQVPAGEEHELVDRLLDMPVLPQLDLPPELKLEEVHHTPRPLLMIHPPSRSKWQHDRLKAEVRFDYDGVNLRGSSGVWAVVQRSAGRCLVRDRGAEAQAWTQLQDCGFRRLLDQRRGAFDVELPAKELGAAVRRLVAEGWQVRADDKQVHQPLDMKFRVQSGIDWFELHADVDFGGQHVAFPELLSALQRGESTIVLDDGSLGILPEEWIKKYGLLSGLGVTEGDHLRFSTVQAGILDALLLTQNSVDYDAKFSEMRQKLNAFAGITTIQEPPSFQGELRPYQRQGLGWLRFLDDFDFGGCLADDMGLGKTIQILAYLEERRQRIPEHRPSLVVVPKSLLFNWLQECEKFTPNLKVLEYSGMERTQHRKKMTQKDLIVTTYGTLRRDVLFFKEIAFDCVILDEAQTVKNSGSQVAKASRLLNGRRRLALTGTPIENHLGDLWSIFEFLNPGMLGRSSLFKVHAANPEDRETRRILAEGLRPLILRRTKQTVASELPEKLEQTIVCRMSPDHERLYNELRDHYRDTLLGLVAEQGIAKSKMHVLEALLRLRQAACHPALLHKISDEESSAKLDVLVPYLEELLEEGHKVLVFSQFTSMLAIVRKHLDKRNIIYEYLDGQTRDRKERVTRFQTDDQCGVFLISLKAGGLGLNLTAADYVFLLDPWWNPAVEMQAIDRAHRVGQTRPVFAYRLICQNTVEEKISELQQQKRELADAILEQNNSVLQSLTADDLKLLLS